MRVSLNSWGEAPEEDWHDQYYGGKIRLDPGGYDTEGEYQEAAAEKKICISAIPDDASALA